MKFPKKFKYIHVILIIYFLINLFFLTGFPFIHSDEAWLSGLSRTILREGSYNVTEPFFDLYPRSPHAIRSIFNSIQIIFLNIFGYQIFTFRLISLLFGTLSLYYFYKLAIFCTSSIKLSSLITILMAVDIQFIYASHIARQEILLVFIFIISLYLFLTKLLQENSNINNFILALLIIIAIGIHPNSFIIFLPLLFTYLYYILFTNKLSWKDLIIFIITVAAGALFFFLLSLYFDPNFVTNYSEYGETLGVFTSIQTKFDRLDYFYQKLYYQVSGTYFTPDIKPQFYLFGITLIYTIYKTIFKNDYINNTLLISFLAVNIGYVLIGRYNQTSIIFIFPILYLLILNSFKSIDINYSKTIITALIILISLNSFFIIYDNTYFNYDDYLDEISTVVNKDDKVLANLNSHYYFDYNKLHDYRNLAYLSENNLSFSDYIEKNQIEYIIYPEEMDFIYNTRPTWNTLYGNIYPYYTNMQNFLENNCTLVKEINNITYGIRIAQYIGEKNWKVKIFKVKEP